MTAHRRPRPHEDRPAPVGLFFWRRSRSHTHMFQSKLSIFLGVYTIIGFLVGLITLAKSVGGPSTVSYEIGPAILAGALAGDLVRQDIWRRLRRV